MIEYVLCDLDGTIADTFDIFFRALNESAEKYHFRKVEPEEIESYRNMHASAIIRKLGVPLRKMPEIAKDGRRRLYGEIIHAKPFEGIESMVERLHKNYKLGIITSNSKRNTRAFLSNNNLGEYFSDIHGSLPLFGKWIAIYQLLFRNHLYPHKLAYVADEIRDIREGKLARVHVISVGWGYNTKEALERENPGNVISKPGEIFGVLDKIERKT